MARPTGRTNKYKDIAEKLEDYVEKADIPVLAEFAYKNDLTREYLYTLSKEDARLFNAIKKCTTKKEAVLEIGALKGELDKTMAIFSLKQLGWSDHVEQEHDNTKVDALIDAFNKIAEKKNE